MIKFPVKGNSWCPYCLRAAKALHGVDAPRHGDIGICRACGHTIVISTRSGIYNALKKPHDTDWEWIETNPNYLALLGKMSV